MPNYVNMVVADSDSVSVRVFFQDVDAAIHFADWLALNGFKVQIIGDIIMEAQPRTVEEEQLARGLWRAYEAWQKTAQVPA
jgi:hypothetical protein